jgi:epoxyqueuosine reductase QueG
MSDDDLKKELKGSAMRRAKAEGLRRNVRIALENVQ